MAESSYWLLTLGTGIRTGGEILRAIVAGRVVRGLVVVIVAGAVLQVAGLALFFYTMWTRIRPTGSGRREAQGERF